MPINRDAIYELQGIIRKEYGQELTEREAWDAAINLLNFFTALTTTNSRIESELRDSSSSSVQADDEGVPSRKV